MLCIWQSLSNRVWQLGSFIFAEKLTPHFLQSLVFKAVIKFSFNLRAQMCIWQFFSDNLVPSYSQKNWHLTFYTVSWSKRESNFLLILELCIWQSPSQEVLVKTGNICFSTWEFTLQIFNVRNYYQYLQDIWSYQIQ